MDKQARPSLGGGSETVSGTDDASGFGGAPSGIVAFANKVGKISENAEPVAPLQETVAPESQKHRGKAARILNPGHYTVPPARSFHSGSPAGVSSCQVSAWSSWSACSQTCGLGQSRRHRRIVRYPQKGAAPCPPLHELRWCGSARACRKPDTYFRWNR